MNRQEATIGHFRYKKCVYFMIPVLLYSVAVLSLVAVYALAQGPDAGNVSTPFGETFPLRAFRAGHYLVAGVSFGCGMVACLLLENRGEGGHPLCFIVALWQSPYKQGSSLLWLLSSILQLSPCQLTFS
jgi:hypothetical protein